MKIHFSNQLLSCILVPLLTSVMKQILCRLFFKFAFSCHDVVEENFSETKMDLGYVG